MRKVIFFDWDGTLSPDGETVSDATRQAIRRAQEAGHLCFLCTARSYSWLAEESLKLGLDGIVCGVGTHVYVGEKTIFSTVIPKDILKKFVLHILKDGQPCWLEGEKQCFLIHFDSSIPSKMIYINSWEELEPWLEECPVSKIALKKRRMSPSTEELLKPDFSLYFYPTFQVALLPGCTKASGMREVLDYFHLDREDSICFGDSVGDLEMLKYAGFSVAVGEPCEEVKALSDLVVPTVEDGIAKLFEELSIL